jgi:hypothetical protein
MSPDDLNTFLEQFTRAIFDPTAPLPTAWPVGALGVLLVFCTQIGAGIPLGVILARDAGLSPLVTASLYLISDIFLACTFEPMLLLLRWLAKRVDFVARLGNRLAKISGATGLSQGKVQGPLGLILFSFAVAPAPARAASEAAGHGFISGWTLAIIGDMIYFTLIMVSTLWVSSVFGDDRLAVGAVLVFAWLLPILLRRLRRDSSDAYTTTRPRGLRVATAPVMAAGGEPLESPDATRLTSKKPNVSHNGRRRRTTRTRYH